MIYDLEKMMVDIIDNWDSSIFCYGGDTSSAGYTQKEYELLGYENKQQFTLDSFFREFNFSNSIKGDNIGQTLSDGDRETLAEHAEALFFNVLEKDKIYRYMLKLALHVNRYRYLKTRETRLKDLISIGKPYINKNVKKEQKLKKLAEEMILLMGGDVVIYEGITNELKKISNYPHAYIPKYNLKIAIPKKEIKAYLFSLKLKKAIEINAFIEEID